MKKKLLIALGILLALALVMGLADFARVTDFERPLFCVCTRGADDGGSGTYRGLGYSFDIRGNFLPEDEFPGVTEFEARILGIPVLHWIRD